jgi:hypothetical protein
MHLESSTTTATPEKNSARATKSARTAVLKAILGPEGDCGGGVYLLKIIGF